MNPIQLENSQPGTSGWQLADPAINREIEGYASLTGVNVGDNIDLFVHTTDSHFTLEIFRTGWYGGIGARKLFTESNLTGQEQVMPQADEHHGRLIECNWQNPYTLSIGRDWVSGIYLARLTGNESQKQSYIIFVVRDDSRAADLVFQSSFTTFQAYNYWPGIGEGYSLYEWAHPVQGSNTGIRARKVSFNRPYALGKKPGAESGLGAGEYLTNVQPEGYDIFPAGFEYNMVRWLEQKGYDVTYITNIDLHENPSLLLKHKGYLSVGHNEYWSMEMREGAEDALKRGIHLGFFSSNTLYWQVRLEPSSDGKANRTMVCYKDAQEDPKRQNNPQLTAAKWRDTPVNKPEAALLGVQYVGDPVKAGSILIANASHWLMNGTGLKNGDCLPGMLAYEADAFVPGVTPADTDILATSPVGPFPNDHDFPPGVSGTPNSSCVSHVTWYSNGKASVFATGSMGWSWGLDDYNAPELRPAFSNVAAQQITENLLDSFIHPITITVPRILPAALRGNLYQLALSAVGGTPPYVWTVSGLPPDLNLNNSGLLDGISNGQATVHFTVTATDANQQTASAALTLPIQEAPQNPKVLSITFIGQGTAMAPTESAGVVPKTNWNNALGNTRTVPLPLADESGLMTGASVTWTSDNPWSMPIADSPGDCRMMKGYLDNGEGNVTTVNVSGLLPSPKGYDIYVYVDADNESENKTGTYSIGGPGITSLSVTATDLANTDFTGAFQQAQNSPGNYVKFSGVNATTFTLIASPQSGHRAPVNAMQIVPCDAR